MDSLFDFHTCHHWMRTLCVSLRQFRVGSHRLRVEVENELDWLDKIFQLCHLCEVEVDEHVIF
jgi:hypothetical protein